MRYSWGVVSVGEIERGQGTEERGSEMPLERTRDFNTHGHRRRLQRHGFACVPGPGALNLQRHIVNSPSLPPPPVQAGIGISKAVCEVRTRVALRLTE